MRAIIKGTPVKLYKLFVPVWIVLSIPVITYLGFCLLLGEWPQFN